VGHEQFGKDERGHSGQSATASTHTFSGFDALDELEAERTDFQGRHSSVAGHFTARSLPNSY
jgi:hypothetical protein